MKKESAMNKWCARPWIFDPYPMCRLSDMYTNLIATFMYAGFTLYSVMEGEMPTGIIVGTIGFCALEVIIHTMFGIQMYQRFHDKGKQTIIKKRDNDYAFPSAGYFERFLK